MELLPWCRPYINYGLIGASVDRRLSDATSQRVAVAKFIFMDGISRTIHACISHVIAKSSVIFAW